MARGTQSFNVEVQVGDDLWVMHGAPAPDPVCRPQDSRPSLVHRRGVRWGALFLTLALHALLFSPLLLGTPGRKFRPPLTDGAAVNAQNAEASEFVSTLIILPDRSITDPAQHDDSAYDVIIREVEQRVQDPPSLAELALVSQPEISGSETATADDAPTPEVTGDDAGRARLFGIYMGQVKARIERAWEHPATPEGTFQCKVQISQGDHGEVKEVTLQHCNPHPAWQVSLVQAIQRASPLPAPPTQKVFSAVLTLNFDAQAAH